ncbi:MAG: MarR family transcriptional regulator [Ornithinimicrobium sp.]
MTPQAHTEPDRVLASADEPSDALAAGDVRWLDEPEQRAWRAWLRGYRLLMVALEDGLAGSGVRMGEYEVLSMLGEAPEGRMRMSALADKVVQSRSRLTHTAKRLEGLGLVQRERIVRDGRGVEVAVTQAGYDLLERVAPMHLDTVRDCFVDQMSREELLHMGEIMRRVIVATRDRPEQGADAF